jgi:hypothetical protein
MHDHHYDSLIYALGMQGIVRYIPAKPSIDEKYSYLANYPVTNGEGLGKSDPPECWPEEWE